MNEEKFTGMADIYGKFRPSYPNGLIDYLYSEAGFGADSAIADIGAGTGIFSGLMLERGSVVTCVEPNRDMLNAAERALAEYDKVSFVEASAEDTRLPAASLDFITVAQAFHWFDRPRFRAECIRILRSGGRVALIWNRRDDSAPLVGELFDINNRYCPNFKGFTGGSPEAPEAYSDFFDGGECDFRIFANDLMMDEAGFVGRSLSSSYAPRENDADYDAYVGELRTLFAKYSSDGRLLMPHYTSSYVGGV